MSPSSHEAQRAACAGAFARSVAAAAALATFGARYSFLDLVGITTQGKGCRLRQLQICRTIELVCIRQQSVFQLCIYRQNTGWLKFSKAGAIFAI